MKTFQEYKKEAEIYRWGTAPQGMLISVIAGILSLVLWAIMPISIIRAVFSAIIITLVIFEFVSYAIIYNYGYGRLTIKDALIPILIFISIWYWGQVNSIKGIVLTFFIIAGLAIKWLTPNYMTVFKEVLLVAMAILTLTLIWDPNNLNHQIAIVENIIGNAEMEVSIGNLLLKLLAVVIGCFFLIAKALLTLKVFLIPLSIGFLVYNRLNLEVLWDPNANDYGDHGDHLFQKEFDERQEKAKKKK